MPYKIKIYTSNNGKDQLVYNDLRIDKLTKINKELINDDIKSIIFLEKILRINRNIYTTSLEFLYDNKISEDEFILFIKNLKKNNFKVLCEKTKIHVLCFQSGICKFCNFNP